MKTWREYRGPRPGEVEAYLSRHCTAVTRELNQKHGTTEVRFKPSPCCGHDKRPAALVNATTGLWSCKACGKVGNWFTLTRTFGDPLPEADRYKDGDLRIPWAAYEPLRAAQRRPVTAGHYPELLKYCLWRGLSPATLDAWRVTTKGPKALRWPIYGWDGQRWTMANARLRVVIDRAEAKTADWFEVKGGPTTLAIGNHLLGVDNWPRTEVPPEATECALETPEVCGGTQALPPGPLTHHSGDKRVLITEGQWDAMTAWELGIPNVLSLPHGAGHMNVAQLLRYVPDDWEVWLALDMDEAGQLATERAFAQLGSDRVARIEMPCKDLNEWLMSDPGLTAKDVLDAAVGITKTMAARQGVAETKPAKKKSCISMDLEEHRGPRLICEAPWRGLTDMLSGGFKGGATTGLLAPSGRGKTTIANQIAIHAASKGVTVAMVMLEDTRANVRNKLVQQARGWTGLENGELKDMLSHVCVSTLEGNRVTWQDCGKWFEEMIDEGAKLLVLDNLDYIMPRTGGDPNKEKMEAYGRMIELAKLHDVHVIAVWQPKKVEQNKVVSSGDQKGMAQAYQDSDNYLNLNWFGNFRRLEVEKHRESGVKDNRQHVWLTYDEQTRCMIEVPAEQMQVVKDQWECKPP